MGANLYNLLIVMFYAMMHVMLQLHNIWHSWISLFTRDTLSLISIYQNPTFHLWPSLIFVPSMKFSQKVIAPTYVLPKQFAFIFCSTYHIVPFIRGYYAYFFLLPYAKSLKALEQNDHTF